MLATSSVTSPNMDETERDKKEDKDGYGARNDAGWSPQSVRREELRDSPTAVQEGLNARLTC